MSDLGVSPCQKLKCQRCCYETEMTLTNEDVRRISALGHKNYYMMHKDFIQLRNIDGRCFFRSCTPVTSLPKITATGSGEIEVNGSSTISSIDHNAYALVLDIDEWEVVLHDFCRHTDHFHFDEEDVEMLKEIIKTDEEERRLRLSPARKRDMSNNP